ncbi:HAMP domain-containing sensor histidine kinase [Verrucomicrobium sp. BvORR106]|uniref:sensor histidine kinase n=1 Tax=Verrucomicrobium sp. BvORR106 TaxID=1403819 RepID=UPI0005711A20|nr:HAMP domain-containing sensor histidine kinase [Verrucomicrobium sp. BvORR106]
MPAQRLPWRIVLPFAGLVLAGSVALLVWMVLMVGREDRSRFESLARTNAGFMGEAGFPPTERMARQLGEVLDVDVAFRRQGKLIPESLPELPVGALLELPADGRCHAVGEREAVGVQLPAGGDLLLVRPQRPAWRGLWQPLTFAVLGAFWLLALGVGWLVSRGLVLPLRNLASRLPEIEKPGELDLPEARRNDEIGDVARAFVRTREALQEERIKREQAEKLAVLGRMTAALAHEIQNPVSAIKMHAQLAALDGNSPIAEVIASEAARIEGLVNQWMFLSRPEPPALQLVELKPLIESVVVTHGPQMRHAGVVVELHVPEVIQIMADRRRLVQVFSNLLINATQAMPLGGVTVVTAVEEQGSVKIAFADEGKGFTAEALERFAEFFYSEREGGMGIGLTVASEVIKAHGGTLSVANVPRGAVVTVTLPLAPPVPHLSVSHSLH